MFASTPALGDYKGENNMRSTLALVALSILLTSCTDDGAAPGDASPPTAETLCVSSSCGERKVLLQIPSAENLHFTDDGRLFVSSGQGFFEIRRNDDGSFRADPAYEGASCGFTGIASREGYLYAACGNGTLWGGKLEATTTLEPIFQISGMCIANGMAMGADGNLYVVDEPLSLCVPDPKVVRLQLDPADPLHVVAQAV